MISKKHTATSKEFSIDKVASVVKNRKHKKIKESENEISYSEKLDSSDESFDNNT